MRQEERKAFRFQMNKLALGVLIYNVIMSMVIIADTMVRTIIIMITVEGERKQELLMDRMIEQLTNSGWSSIFGVTVGILFLLLFFYREHLTKIMFWKSHKMTVKAFFMILSVFMSAQIVFSFVAGCSEMILNVFGYTMLGEIESASAQSTTVSMFLYACIVAPVGEELVYRGFVLRFLQRYGKVFAIIVSSILFGVMHGNLIQAMFAFSIGLVLGYVATEYSIKWSIFLHFLNNCIFGDLLSYVLSWAPEAVQNGISNGIMLVFFVAGLIIIIYKHREIGQYIRENKSLGKFYLHALTAIWMIVFIVIEIGMGISGIERLS
ncbi:MAG: CPBP family intramembrane metalloprotease [Clostridiales bacterium]|nr:CPBP family intramembrane metalloprotease [Clostridiales bacterium]